MGRGRVTVLMACGRARAQPQGGTARPRPRSPTHPPTETRHHLLTLSSCTPQIRPSPRTSWTPATPASSARRPARRRSPRAATPSRKAASLMMPNTASAAAHTRGLPANVDPWSPGAMAAATRSVSSTAPIGRPPASGLASVMMSGATPKCSWPHRRPVRPRPTCTSSNTSRAPASSHARLRPPRKSAVAACTPPSPCSGSTNTAHVSPLASTALAASKSRYGTLSAPGRPGAKGVLYWALYVSASAPIVRPWKQWSNDSRRWGAVAAGSYGSTPAAVWWRVGG